MWGTRGAFARGEGVSGARRQPPTSQTLAVDGVGASGQYLTLRSTPIVRGWLVTVRLYE